MKKTIIGCIPVSVMPIAPTDQEDPIKEACAKCNAEIWVSKKKRAIRDKEGIPCMCMMCGMTELGNIAKTTFPSHLTDYLTDIRSLPGNRYAAINRYFFTCAIIVGDIDNKTNFDDRWCYHSYRDAKEALDNWNGEGEPEGWHRHPHSGRRRNEEGEEYVHY